MALTSTALKKIAGAGDQNLFVYKSTDAIGTIVASAAGTVAVIKKIKK